MPDLRRPFVFLDRDGTLVADTGYPHRLEDYALLPSAALAARRLSDAGWRLAIVTNQSGIGRGLFDEHDFWRFHNRLLSDLARAGAPVAATLVCPHSPEDECTCRKPNPGLLLRAEAEFGAKLSRSLVVGDQSRDIEAGRRAGCLGGIRIGAEGDAADVNAAADKILAGTFPIFDSKG